MSGGEATPGPGKGDGALRRGRLVRLAGLCAVGAAGYVGLRAAAAAAGADLPDAVGVGVPFLLWPAVALWWWGQPAEWGKFDRTFALSAAAYAPFALWVVLAVPDAPPKYFAALPGLAFAFPSGPLWALATFVHVGSVDYFTKRVVQLESESLWDPARAQLVQLVAWSAGHVVEYLWLREVLGDVGAAAFLVSAGVVTGWAFARWKCVVGLMFGHLLVNVAAAGAALSVYG